MSSKDCSIGEARYSREGTATRVMRFQFLLSLARQVGRGPTRAPPQVGDVIRSKLPESRRHPRRLR
jgi:hypothetical protein